MMHAARCTPHACNRKKGFQTEQQACQARDKEKSRMPGTTTSAAAVGFYALRPGEFDYVPT